MKQKTTPNIPVKLCRIPYLHRGLINQLAKLQKQKRPKDQSIVIVQKLIRIVGDMLKYNRTTIDHTVGNLVNDIKSNERDLGRAATAILSICSDISWYNFVNWAVDVRKPRKGQVVFCRDKKPLVCAPKYLVDINDHLLPPWNISRHAWTRFPYPGC